MLFLVSELFVLVLSVAVCAVLFCNVGESIFDSSACAIWGGRCVVVCGGGFVFNAHGAGAVTAAWVIFGRT